MKDSAKKHDRLASTERHAPIGSPALTSLASTITGPIPYQPTCMLPTIVSSVAAVWARIAMG